MTSHSVTPYKNKSVPLNLSINTTNNKTPKDGSSTGNSNAKKSNYTVRSDDRLNLSVDVGHKAIIAKS